MSAANSKSMPPTPTTPSAPKSKKSKKKKKAANKASADDEQNEPTSLDTDAVEAGSESTAIAATDAQDDDSGPDPDQDEPSQHLDDTSKETDNNGSRAANASVATEGTEGPKVVNGTTQARLDVLLQEREALREQVTNFRKSLEDLQLRHTEQVDALQEQVSSERAEKETAQEEYQNLLGRVNTLRTQLTERLKADAEQLAEARTEIEQLQSHNATLKEEQDGQAAELRAITLEREEQTRELSTLRNRTTLSQQNWNEERDDLIQREASAREEFENAKQAMQDWEILAMEERTIRQSLETKHSELEETVESHKEAYEKIKQQRDTQANTVEGLQKGLQDIQEARKQELREIVEKTQSEISQLRKQLDEATSSEKTSRDRVESLQNEMDRLLPLETELKEKNLLIGKLRHEAVILNDHLTKALRQLKRGKTEDVIDRQLVTNHFLQFLNLTHGDPKKFQILQLIAAMLNWTDEQREQAGLSRPGVSNPSLRSPISPWHRTPSTPTLNAANLGVHAGELGGRKESIAGLFSEFLESEAEGGSSKATSISGSSRPTS